MGWNTPDDCPWSSDMDYYDAKRGPMDREEKEKEEVENDNIAEFEDAWAGVRNISVLFAKFFGHCSALSELRDGNNIDDAWVARRLRELVAEYGGLLKCE